MSGRAYVEHVAIRVRDLDWHIRFFGEVLGMPLTLRHGKPGEILQVWTLGGLQLIADPDIDETCTGRLAHIGIQCKELSLVLEAAQSWGVSSLPDKPGWLQLPQGLVIECIQANPGSVEMVLSQDPRAGGQS